MSNIKKEKFMVKFVVSGVERRVDGKSIFIKKGYITVDGKVVNLDDCVGEPIEIVIQEFVNVFVG